MQPAPLTGRCRAREASAVSSSITRVALPSAPAIVSAACSNILSAKVDCHFRKFQVFDLLRESYLFLKKKKNTGLKSKSKVNLFLFPGQPLR